MWYLGWHVYPMSAFLLWYRLQEPISSKHLLVFRSPKVWWDRVPSMWGHPEYDVGGMVVCFFWPRMHSGQQRPHVYEPVAGKFPIICPVACLFSSLCIWDGDSSMNGKHSSSNLSQDNPSHFGMLFCHIYQGTKFPVGSVLRYPRAWVRTLSSPLKSSKIGWVPGSSWTGPFNEDESHTFSIKVHIKIHLNLLASCPLRLGKRRGCRGPTQTPCGSHWMLKGRS